MKSKLFVFVLLACHAVAIAAGAQTTRQPPRDPDKIAAEREAGCKLKDELEQAIAQKLPRMVMAPGIYRVSPDSPNAAHLFFHNISNFELIADGVQLICETKNTAISIIHCDHLKIRGITIDYDPLPMTQGTITAVSPHSLDFKIDDGYDAPDYDGKGVGHIWVADAVTRQVKPGSVNYGSHKEIVDLGNKAYRLVTQWERRDAVRPGDHIKLPQRLNLRAPHGIDVYGSKALTFENVTIESAPCFGFVSTWGEDISLNRVRVVPGPPPPGATEPRIFSSSADGINLQDNTRGPVIRNCMVTSNGDDGIAIYNQPDLVLGNEGAGSLLIGLNWPDPKRKVYAPGDTLRFFLFQSGRTEERKIASVQPAPPPEDIEQIMKKCLKTFNKASYHRTVKVGLDSPLAGVAGDMVLDTRYAGRGFEISNNVLVNNASRGININQSYGTVSGNKVTHSYLPGIHMTEFMRTDSGGSSFQTSVDIKDNVVTDACIGYPGRKDWQGAISIVAWDAGAGFVDGHSNISITGNTIDKPNGIGIQVQCGSKIVIEGNIFGSLEKVGNAKNGAPAILLVHCNIDIGHGCG
jgi:hypothetical protein